MNSIAEYILNEGWLGICRMDLIVMAFIVFCFKPRGGVE